jgi:NAD(P)-dependent dehydrogenase (short-subunit alcohol dehydrogenase family)
MPTPTEPSARPRTWFITGGTPGGFGMAYAEAALSRGDRVALTARRGGLLQGWARDQGDRALALSLDVTDPVQVQAAVGAAEERFGGIDVLVNSAGRGWVGSVEGMGEADLRSLFELNFFAAVSVTRAVLPGMRDRRGGWIVMMSSVAGLRPVPGFGYYTAAKHAIEGLAATLRTEVADFGVRVLTVEPGAFRTRAYAGFADEPIAEPLTAYHPLLESVRAAMIGEHGRQPGDPRRGAEAVLDAMDRAAPPHRLVLGGAAFDAVTKALDDEKADIEASEALARGADFPAGR